MGHDDSNIQILYCHNGSYNHPCCGWRRCCTGLCTVSSHSRSSLLGACNLGSVHHISPRGTRKAIYCSFQEHNWKGSKASQPKFQDQLRAPRSLKPTCYNIPRTTLNPWPPTKSLELNICSPKRWPLNPNFYGLCSIFQYNKFMRNCEVRLGCWPQKEGQSPWRQKIRVRLGSRV